ncbi:TonB-dependent receptor [Roseateles sp. DAIF2]|uniref:TonB-dependent receptor family protein n=1 Tax=Roseateles sp. DAIF2 TaxID=2714952 RepID=UPI0018A27B99|nr:TonB-dependent receptor [Roseateles sp. DAIF2]QPF72187.1 TonB-dependent receptor [Roseateles sp. DAIF2]
MPQPISPPAALPLALLAAAALGLPAAGAQAQDATTLERVVLDQGGAEQRLFDTPYAVSVIDAEQLRNAGPMVNLSEALQHLPGIVANPRHNYAQDLQLSSRGFGARASFGVRGLRLYSDGIPATGPDGQGQVSHFDLAGAQRIEVLRGPFSALYGNSSGGAILLHSAAPIERRLLLDSDIASNGQRQWRLGLELPASSTLPFSLRAQLASFETDGFRPQSASRRDLANLRLAWDGARDRVVLILNAIEQPAKDPLGLTRAQLSADPHQTAELALPQAEPGEPDRFNTRKSTRQRQLGLSWRHRFEDAGALQQLQLSAHLGRREVRQWQSIPVASQANARQPGGVIAFERDYHGLDGRLVWSWPLADPQRRARVVLGAALDDSREHRQGYENFIGSGEAQLLGVTGRLRRDERNRLGGRDLYAQADIDLAPRWQASLGLRRGEAEFKVRDRYVGGANPDDSGRKRYDYSNPFAALQWRTLPTLNTYLSLGRGFESPTQGELAYRNDGLGGFNPGLRAQTSRQAELGAKWRPDPGLALDAALFQADSRDEIAVAGNSGGRASYRNVGRTRREGAELEARWRAARDWRGQFSLSWLDARYRDGFTTCAAAPCLAPSLLFVAPGRRIAGTISRSAYAELAWAALPGLELAVEGRAQGRQWVNDINSDAAAGYGLVHLRARWQIPLGPGRLELLGRVDNVADRDYVSSVIVNEGNGRFFEPAPGRTWLLSLRWQQGW